MHSNFSPFNDVPDLQALGVHAEQIASLGGEAAFQALVSLRKMAESYVRGLLNYPSSRAEKFGDLLESLLRDQSILKRDYIICRELWNLGNRAAHADARGCTDEDIRAGFELAIELCARASGSKIGRKEIRFSRYYALPSPRERLEELEALLASERSYQEKLTALNEDLKRELMQVDDRLKQLQDEKQDRDEALINAQTVSKRDLQEIEELKEDAKRAAALEASFRETEREIKERLSSTEQELALGNKAYMLHYPDGDWNKIPSFWETLLNNNKPPFEEYKVITKLGEGAFGKAILARPRSGGSRVAIKLPRAVASPRELDRLKNSWIREIRRWRSLDYLHPRVDGVAYPRRISDEEAPAWVILDYIDGPPLSEWIKDGSLRDPAIGLALLQQVTRTLIDLSNQGVGFVDLHERNIILNMTYRTPKPILIDVGPARPPLPPPEWNSLSLSDLTTPEGAGTSALERGHVWSLARLACLLVLGEENGSQQVGRLSDAESLAHLGSPRRSAPSQPSRSDLERVIRSTLSSRSKSKINVTCLAEFIAHGLRPDPQKRRPKSLREALEHLRSVMGP